MFTLVVLWRDVVSRGVDLGGDFLVGKFEVANAMGVSGPTPLRGSLPRLLGGPGGAPAGPGPTRAQSYQGVQAIAHLSLQQVRWT